MLINNSLGYKTHEAICDDRGQRKWTMNPGSCIIVTLLNLFKFPLAIHV